MDQPAATRAIKNFLPGQRLAIVGAILAHEGVIEACEKVLGQTVNQATAPKKYTAGKKVTASTIDWSTILAVILPFVEDILTGGTIDWSAIIADILGLLTPATPT